MRVDFDSVPAAILGKIDAGKFIKVRLPKTDIEWLQSGNPLVWLTPSWDGGYAIQVELEDAGVCTCQRRKKP
jgi:hypothetical protein